jgi:hypothetical protein
MKIVIDNYADSLGRAPGNPRQPLLSAVVGDGLRSHLDSTSVTMPERLLGLARMLDRAVESARAA